MFSYSRCQRPGENLVFVACNVVFSNVQQLSKDLLLLSCWLVLRHVYFVVSFQMLLIEVIVHIFIFIQSFYLLLNTILWGSSETLLTGHALPCPEKH